MYSTRGIPGSRRLLVGEPFVQRANVDYIFTAAPHELKLDRKEQEVTKVEIGWVQAEDQNAFLELFATNPKGAMDFAEKRLKRSPNQPLLLDYYVSRTTEDKRTHVEEFLKSGLDRRPVNIPWHRWYQQFAEMNNHDSALVALYDKYLAAEPSSGALVYLRGRIDPDWDKQEAFYRRAIAADPKFGWPWMSIAARANARGQWDESLKAALKARELNVSETDMLDNLIHEARMAKGDAGALVPQYRAAMMANVQDISALLLLMDALAASGKANEIDGAINSWTMRVPAAAQGQIVPHLKALGLYYAGSLKECAEYCDKNFQVKSSPVHLHALLGLGRMKEASDEAAFKAAWQDPFNILAVSVAFALEGGRDESARWRDKAAGAIKKLGGKTDVGKAAELLTAAKPPSIEEARRYFVPSSNKALILAALADLFPAKRASRAGAGDLASRLVPQSGPQVHEVPGQRSVPPRRDHSRRISAGISIPGTSARSRNLELGAIAARRGRWRWDLSQPFRQRPAGRRGRPGAGRGSGSPKGRRC